MSERVSAMEGIMLAGEFSQYDVDLKKVLEDLGDVMPDHAHWRTELDLPQELKSLPKPFIAENYQKETQKLLLSRGIEAYVDGKISSDDPSLGVVLEPMYEASPWNPQEVVRTLREVDFVAEMEVEDQNHRQWSRSKGLFRLLINTTRVEGNIYRPHIIGTPALDHPRTGVLLLTRGEGYIGRVIQRLEGLAPPMTIGDYVFSEKGTRVLTAFYNNKVARMRKAA